MPMKLRDALREVTAGWQVDLPQGWQQILAGVELGEEAIPAALDLAPWEPVFPVRKGAIFPGAPEGAHMLKAFDVVAPGDVRVVLLGQDPYPEPAAATGRAFEIGTVQDWRDMDRMFSRSIRAWSQMLFAARYSRPELARSFADWPGMLDEIESGALPVGPHLTLSDQLERQGVLLLNAALTLTRFKRDIDPHQSQGHVRLWRPLIQATLAHAAALPHPVVFVALGSEAEGHLRDAGLLESHPRHLAIVLPHPAFADEFLACPNLFEAANSHFAAHGQPQIDW